MAREPGAPNMCRQLLRGMLAGLAVTTWPQQVLTEDDRHAVPLTSVAIPNMVMLQATLRHCRACRADVGLS